MKTAVVLSDAAASFTISRIIGFPRRSDVLVLPGGGPSNRTPAPLPSNRAPPHQLAPAFGSPSSTPSSGLPRRTPLPLGVSPVVTTARVNVWLGLVQERQTVARFLLQRQFLNSHLPPPPPRSAPAPLPYLTTSRSLSAGDWHSAYCFAGSPVPGLLRWRGLFDGVDARLDRFFG
ncbi:hypothetical protein GWK47_015768 [Chionoecetes opilio]|uniref:Uncharacterized protein n=1 Tax=Chionoecetes opilio TaxID=41210 RepID=A0A8J4XYR7_CHIOP|nr:hypothetical protein GWK47_015768 [Chionoecetes opilio]